MEWELANQRFLLYGLGSGRGHATRTAALARELEALGASVRLFVSFECSEVVRAIGLEPVRVCAVSAEEARAAWERELACFEPTHCVVDTFPEGLWRELRPSREGPTRWVALLRCRRDAGAASFLDPLARYALAYDLEPALEWAPKQLVPFGAVVRPLRALDSPAVPASPSVLLVASEPVQRPFLERLGERLERSGIQVALVPGSGVSRYAAPLLDPSARVVVGPAGYNLTYELAALGVWHLALPAPRQYDDQELRAGRVAAVAFGPEAVERRVRLWLERSVRRQVTSVRPMRELARALLTLA